jgi:protocatechuate 3,4-dioxygenase beta subunit
MKNDQAAGYDPRRRATLRAMLAVPVVGLAGWRTGEGSVLLAPTPACADDGPTPAQGAGPYFKPSSPERGSLLDPGLAGTPLVVSGQVLSTACAPVPRALLDFWHADDGGEYDLQGFRLRGHQYADASGRFRLQTILPGGYSGRTRHIHVNVQAPGGRVLTTALYFPGEEGNRRDGMFSPRLVVDMAPGGQGTFNFVLAG